MPRYVIGDTVTELWTILDFSSDPLTGMTTPGDITFTLHNDDGAGNMAASSEAVSFAEIGVTGHYTVSYAPLSAAVYVLQLKELAATSLQRTYRYEDAEVLSAGTEFTAAYSNAFCNEADIERWLQTAISATSAPTATEATGFAETRAAILMSKMEKWGYSVTPATVTAGSRIEDLLRRANAIGAALDYSVAQQFAVRPSRSDRVPALEALWIQLAGDEEGKIDGAIKGEIKGNLASLSTDHILSGDTTIRPTVDATDAAIGFSVGDLF